LLAFLDFVDVFADVLAFIDLMAFIAFIAFIAFMAVVTLATFMALGMFANIRDQRKQVRLLRVNPL